MMLSADQYRHYNEKVLNITFFITKSLLYTCDSFVLLLSNIICLSTGSLAKASSVGKNIVILFEVSSNVASRSGSILFKALLINL